MGSEMCIRDRDKVHASEALVDYLQRILAQTRTNGKFVHGLSPRAGLQWLQAKALAFIEGRDAALPDDIKFLAKHTAAHRLHCNDGSLAEDELANIIASTQVI